MSDHECCTRCAYGTDEPEDFEPYVPPPAPPPPLYKLQLVRHLDSSVMAEWPVDFSLDMRGKIAFHVEFDLQ